MGSADWIKLGIAVVMGYLVYSFFMGGLGGLIPNAPDDVVVVTEATGYSDGVYKYVGVIKNTGSNTYDKLVVTMFIDDANGNTVSIKDVPIYDLKPGESRPITDYPMRGYREYIRQITE